MPPIRETVIGAINSNSEELKKLGVIHISIFGSVARGTDGPNSDVDIAIEIDNSKPFSIFRMGSIQIILEKITNRKVDLARKDNLHAAVFDNFVKEAVHVF